jgi:hypothetical protein
MVGLTGRVRLRQLHDAGGAAIWATQYLGPLVPFGHVIIMVAGGRNGPSAGDELEPSYLGLCRGRPGIARSWSRKPLGTIKFCFTVACFDPWWPSLKYAVA